MNNSSYLLNSLTYPNNFTTPQLSNCVLLVNLMKLKEPVKVQTVVVTVVSSGKVIRATRTVGTPPKVHERIYGTSVRLIPIKEYQCGQYYLILINDLRPANVSKILITINEYRLLMGKSEELVSHLIKIGSKFYAELINGSKVLLKRTLSYSVSINDGGYLILKRSKESIVRIDLVISYVDGYLRQYYMNFIGTEVSNICLDSRYLPHALKNVVPP